MSAFFAIGGVKNMFITSKCKNAFFSHYMSDGIAGNLVEKGNFRNFIFAFKLCVAVFFAIAGI